MRKLIQQITPIACALVTLGWIQVALATEDGTAVQKPAIETVILSTIDKARDLVARYRVNITPPADTTQSQKVAYSDLAREHDLILRRLEEQLEITLRKSERDYAWEAARHSKKDEINVLQDKLREDIQLEYEAFRSALLNEIYRYVKAKEKLLAE